MEVKTNVNTGEKDAEGKVIYDTVVLDYDFGSDLDSAIELCGDAARVFNCYVAQAKVSLQAAVRRHGKNGLDADAIAEKMADWKPGDKTARVKKTDKEKVMTSFKSMTDEEQRQFLTDLGMEV